jgi:small-conductance mechanosensitive channel
MRSIVRGIQKGGLRRIGRGARFIPIAIVRLVSMCIYGIVLFTAYAYVTFCLNRFPLTRGLGMQMGKIVWDAMLSVADGVLASIPNVLMLVLIFLVARFASRWTGALLSNVEEGEVSLPFVDRDTVMPTKRLVGVGIWVFALAMAYPFIPGSSTQAFQGVSVLFGLMLSLGASSSIGQAVSGLILLYSKALRVGDYVTVDDTTGRVIRLGFFAARLRTAYLQEITIPNSVLVGATITNHSRLVPHGTT